MIIAWHWLKRNTLKIVHAIWKDISTAFQISWAHLKAIWWLKYLILLIVAILALAIWAQLTKSGESPNPSAAWIYDFLNDWAVALGAAVTLLLATAAFLAILDNRHARTLDRQERLLNEIIEWAEDINIASLTPDISIMGKDSRDAQLLKVERDANTLLRYGISRSKAISILTIAKECFKKELLKYVENVENELIEFMYIKIVILSKTQPDEKDFSKKTAKKMTKEIAEGDKTFDQLFEDHAKNLAESVRELLEEANKTKASLLS